MHPEVIQDAPGMCPECGMGLLEVKSPKSKVKSSEQDKSFGAAQDKHAGHSTAAFFRKFWISLALTIPVVLYADVVGKIFNWSPPDFYGSAYLPLVLGSIVFFYGGWVFLAGAWRELRAKLPGMMTLIGIAISAAYLWSLYAVFAGEEALFWELTTLITIMLLGHWLEMRAVSGAQGALKELSKLLPDTAELADGRVVAISDLKVGDVVLVRPGGRIPADGAVIEGEANVNESMITGESAPVKKIVNSEVIAGTVNTDGSLKIKVTKIGEGTFLAGVMRLVREAQASKSRLQILSDRAAFYLTIIAVAGGLITLIAWLLAGAGTSFAVARLVAVLVIACPHALGLAVPLVASISTTLAARNGFLVKQRLALEAARSVDIVLFDKTGTLTTGNYGVEKIITTPWEQENRVLQLAASVDSLSEHVVSKAIMAEAKKRSVQILPVKDFIRLSGKGTRGKINDAEISVGGMAMVESLGIEMPEIFKEFSEVEGKNGKGIAFVIAAKVILGAFSLGDIIREESREAVAALQKMGIKTAMITGDSENVAKWVAGELGIDEYFARVLPEEKAKIVKQLQEGKFENLKFKIENSRPRRVAMVGDGINDAPALTQADLGIAIGAGTNVAIESAGIILVKNDPRDIVKIIELSRATYRKMIQNLFWATGYNVIALPLAAGVLASQGILLQPAIAGLLMSVSTIIVALNAVLLKRKTL
ncbi:MAG: putative copper-exporting P-type ATPase B [Parcubacteria group bacterium Gr01-1014_3]|nr:MAG: putative copper-exporting P-type ATPase B [Parcubacteria group bacterium Gr01-1014_3]